MRILDEEAKSESKRVSKVLKNNAENISNLSHERFEVINIDFPFRQSRKQSYSTIIPAPA